MSSVEQRTISADDAQRRVEAACSKAGELGLAISVAVVDVAGRLKAFRRMDGAPLLSIDSAQRKAYTAVAVGAPTAALFEAFGAAPALLGQIGELDGIVVLGGGAPIFEGGAAIGAVGVGGGTADQDAEIAESAAA